MPGPVVDVLMYHSISGVGGPTCIAPAVFADQMAAIAEAGVPVITLDDLVAARAGGPALPARSVIITFDDGFQDFAETAWPVMKRHGFRPMVYLPTDYIGGVEGWKGIGKPPRPLMGWPCIRDLSIEGVQFGSHTVTHANLNALTPAQLREELATSRREIEARLGRPVVHFAPPYGLANAAVRAAIARHYDTSVGTVLARATDRSDILNLPRLEMFYFTHPQRWRQHLAGRGGAYLLRRKLLRHVREAITNPWDGI